VWTPPTATNRQSAKSSPSSRLDEAPATDLPRWRAVRAFLLFHTRLPTNRVGLGGLHAQVPLTVAASPKSSLGSPRP
jgi:hypothetical protein